MKIQLFAFETIVALSSEMPQELNYIWYYIVGRNMEVFISLKYTSGIT